MPFNSAGVLRISKTSTGAAHALPVASNMSVGVIKVVTASARGFVAARLTAFASYLFSNIWRNHVREPFTGQNLLKCEIFPCAANNGFSFHTRLLSKFYSFKSHTLNDDKHCSPLIALLFFARGPFAIFFAIALIVLLALKEIASGAGPHVLDKFVEIIYPIITNSYSATSIVFILLCGFAIATAAHRFPHGVKRWWFPLFHGMPFNATGRQSQVGGCHSVQ